MNKTACEHRFVNIMLPSGRAVCADCGVEVREVKATVSMSDPASDGSQHFSVYVDPGEQRPGKMGLMFEQQAPDKKS